jgi:hypothetical protein
MFIVMMMIIIIIIIIIIINYVDRMQGCSTTLQMGTDTNIVTAGPRRLTAMNYCNYTTVSMLSLSVTFDAKGP